MKWNPEDYAKHSDAQLKWAQELKQTLSLQGDESILDVGCGDGKITADFAQTVPHGRVIGLDSSPEMITYATQTYPRDRYPHLSFTCRDARSLGFNNEFDLIFSNAVLHWVDNHFAFLKSASQALKPGGRLIVSCGGFGNAADVLAAFQEEIIHEPWPEYFQEFKNPYFFYSDRDYRPGLAAASLAIERLELVPKTMTHEGKTGFAAWIRTTWMPFTERVPEARREALIAAVVNRYLQRFPLDSQGLALVRMVRLEVDAIKTGSVR